MPRRRDLLLGGPLLLAAGAALALKPRRRMSLLGDARLDDLIPQRFAGWEVTPSNALILPKPREGSLADILYDQQLSRLYTGEGRLPVMLVIAYGSTQSDLLQLHRPETCYRAVGFEIVGSRRLDARIGGAVVPMRQLTAVASDRIEPILYWTRLGDRLPTSGREQRLVKLRTEMEGYIGDGVLVRLSTVAEPSPEVFAALETFARELLLAVSPEARVALVGRPTAAAIARTPAAIARTPAAAAA
ncbi:MAG: EpsI family protein [Sphingomonadaceae bacterium]|uniref:exosortase-associated protein EpsI, V-type n=1 Tax=Thermaurantiacus sp. TaxID=2820283 RepID=UPI00298F2548|nr:exosortase-associated protein EpsI, V-type [Thermaurantiacus sp.]MCS6986090.1 EpsI family protein [Sphingomonadaceae bacterium]MDW8414694.1 EpsI family protein [Thermaurantiacus sp.]